MKNIIIHSVPVVIAFVWIALTSGTFNPIIIKGPDFLKFYMLLIFGFYISVFLLQPFKEISSRITLYFMIFIFALGTIKLVRGLILDKPVGILILILLIQGAAIILLQIKSKI
ncbi:hypothetical protein ATE49_18365 [Elizabethkingia miricola]|uniref:Uncharacterized protein n=1 Tax=Elizabethkingia miricola TaxID=172045 RepID=A0ABD5B4H6_ELIMR|nr:MULTISPECIES: hypothetical protein [Elizabethkingia]MDQ8747988.1 hypothetical protein [Elizabethkingia miricola]OBS14619.1 hypothetical protein ATE49_18365 [Elizabethkingia miricola]OPB89799.1 hypothetical protein BAS06_05460 [Elizabethkingia miricola]TYO92222.1 hypothetical protein LX74_01887 [Elizabethkingia miricola]